ncbi:MAG: 4-hydroxybutyrate CoA-transferase, partial [Chitinophagaceae bacterium]
MSNYMSALEAVSRIQSGDRVFIQGSAATPVHLIKELQNRYGEVSDVELVSITTLGNLDFDKPEYRSSFFVNSLFVSENTRSVVTSNRGDFVPIFLSEIPLLFRRGILPIDVAIIHVSPPDCHGYCSLGTSVDITRSAVETAKFVIAQVNSRMPRTHGDGFIHVNAINALVQHDCELPEVDYSSKVSETTAQIGRNVASLIED